MNCVQQGPGTATGPGGAGGGEGFTPGGQSSGGSEGFTANRGTYSSTVGGGSCSNNDDPFHKCANTIDKEKRWGTSAPIGKAMDDEVDQDVLEDFLLGEPINSMDDIEDLRVYVKLKKTGSGRKDIRGQLKYRTANNAPTDQVHRKFYGGQVTISYDDYDDQGRFRWNKATLRSGTGGDAKYNIWRELDGLGATTSQIFSFHGFFQDTNRAVILVIDKKTSKAQDAEDNTVNKLVGGSIWIMTFKTIFPAIKTKGNSCSDQAVDQVYIRDHNKAKEPLTQGSKKCWFISRGAFDCRAWRWGDGVDTLRRLEPDNNCYTKLGEFSGLDVLKAFGVNKLGDL